MARQITILHGWNDKSGSFRKLERFLAANGYDVTNIWLGDWISTDDDVRIEDVARRMQVVIEELQQKRELDPSFDLIGHSTAGLVMREWVATYYPDGQHCPVQRLVMLAPANFGSRLATLGNSFLGRATKGMANQFQTGREMLNSLELGSLYQRRLATRDLLDPDGNGTGPYGPDRLWPFVITGNRGYRSLTRRLINEDGSDGTIRVPAANLNAGGITVDFSENAKIPRVHAWSSRTGGATIPFSVLPDRDHTQIKYPGDKTDAIAEVSERLGQMILQALACDSPTQYQSIAISWLAASEETAALASDTERRRGLFRRNAPVEQEVHRYLQMITRVSDDQGEPVEDYFIEFFSPDASSDASLVRFQSDVLDHVHVNKQDPSVRCFYIDRDDLMKRFYRERTGDRQLAASIVIANPGRNIRYFDKEVVGAEGHLLLHCDREPDRAALGANRLHRNTTHYVDIIVPRKPLDRVFKMGK
jgi:pimeloyl-ACP methyl ester carboxylesterase